MKQKKPICFYFVYLSLLYLLITAHPTKTVFTADTESCYHLISHGNEILGYLSAQNTHIFIPSSSIFGEQA